jgi:SecD/SecF fusion protein
MRRPLWVLLIYGLLLAAGIALALPNFLPATMRAQLPTVLSANTVSLGLDLQGGAHLLLAIDRDALRTDVLRDTGDQIRAVLAEQGEEPDRLHTTDSGYSLPYSPAVEAELERLAGAYLAPGEPARFTLSRDGDLLLVGVSESALDRVAGDAAARSVEVVRHRVDQVGVAEPQISRVGGDRVLVQLPGVENPGQLRQLLGSTARMTFHMVDEGATAARPGYTLLPARDGGEVAVEDRVALSGDHLVSAAAAFDPQTRAPDGDRPLRHRRRHRLRADHVGECRPAVRRRSRRRGADRAGNPAGDPGRVGARSPGSSRRRRRSSWPSCSIPARSPPRSR